MWHKVVRKSRVIAKPRHLTLTMNCICVGAFFDVLMLIKIFNITTILLYLATGEMPFDKVNACIITPWFMNVFRPVSDMCIYCGKHAI